MIIVELLHSLGFVGSFPYLIKMASESWLRVVFYVSLVLLLLYDIVEPLEASFLAWRRLPHTGEAVV